MQKNNFWWHLINKLVGVQIRKHLILLVYKVEDENDDDRETEERQDRSN